MGLISKRMNALKGFTLVEVIVVTGLVAVLITLGVGIFLSNSRFYENQSGRIISVNAIREAADRINEFARPSLNFENTYTYGSILYATDSDTIIFRMPSIDGTDQIIDAKYDFVIINASSTAPNVLELIVDSDPASSRTARYLVLSERLTSTNFTYDNSDLSLAKNVYYDITVTEIGRNPATERVHGGATLRN